MAISAQVHTVTETVAVVGLGYVGLPTSLALSAAGVSVIGIDVSERRLRDVQSANADLLPRDRDRLAAALDDPGFVLTPDPGAVAAADAVLVCVPTPVDARRRPDLRAVRAACAGVVACARPGQTLILTSTTSVGCTRELLVEPLAARGLRAGADIHVAFSPERIDPGSAGHAQEGVPRVVGGVTLDCAHAAAAVLGGVASEIHFVSSPEAAELCKLHENSFRAVNIAFANEMADAARTFGLDPAEVLAAAATKPYGFMPFEAGAGVGGHCIPCDPHYLLDGLERRGASAPVIGRAMGAIAQRPYMVLARGLELLAGAGLGAAGARVLVVGVAYKPGVRDLRESPGVEIVEVLRTLGAEVAYHDPLVPALGLRDGLTMLSAPARAAGFDLAIVTCLHPGDDGAWIRACPRVVRPA